MAVHVGTKAAGREGSCFRQCSRAEQSQWGSGLLPLSGTPTSLIRPGPSCLYLMPPSSCLPRDGQQSGRVMAWTSARGPGPPEASAAASRVTTLSWCSCGPQGARCKTRVSTEKAAASPSPRAGRCQPLRAPQLLRVERSFSLGLLRSSSAARPHRWHVPAMRVGGLGLPQWLSD